MQLTHLILVHHKPHQLRDQLRLLLQAPGAGDDHAVVHVDAKVDEAPFREVVESFAGRATLTRERHDVRWGGYGAVAATLSALRQGLDETTAEHFLLLSGADLPLQSLDALHTKLSDATVHMNCWPMPDEARNKPMSRLERWHVVSRRRHSPVVHRVNRLLSRLPRRDVGKGLAGLAPFAGSQWWTMPRGCAEEVLAFVGDHPQMTRFFRHVAVPDEIFFQTVVNGLPTPWTIQPSLTTSRWSGGASPDQLTAKDIPGMARTGAFFARKFDIDSDPSAFSIARSLVGTETP